MLLLRNKHDRSSHTASRMDGSYHEPQMLGTSGLAQQWNTDMMPPEEAVGEGGPVPGPPHLLMALMHSVYLIGKVAHLAGQC